MFVKTVALPRAVMRLVILLLFFVGAYAVNNSLTNVYWMLVFGVFGSFMKLYGYPLGPVIPWVIVSRLLADNGRRAIIPDQESLPMLFSGIMGSPPSLVPLLTVAGIFLSKTPLWGMVFRRRVAS